VCLWIWLLRITSGLMRSKLSKLPYFLCILLENVAESWSLRMVWLKGWTGLEKHMLVELDVFSEWIPFSLSTRSPNPNDPFLCVRQFGAFL